MLNFEQAEAALSPAQRTRLAVCVRDKTPLPTPLTEAERAFCFGLTLFVEYGDEAALLAYCAEGSATP